MNDMRRLAGVFIRKFLGEFASLEPDGRVAMLVAVFNPPNRTVVNDQNFASRDAEPPDGLLQRRVFPALIISHQDKFKIFPK